MSCNGDFSKFGNGLVEEFPMLTKRAFEVIIANLSQWLILSEVIICEKKILFTVDY